MVGPTVFGSKLSFGHGMIIKHYENGSEIVKKITVDQL